MTLSPPNHSKLARAERERKKRNALKRRCKLRKLWGEHSERCFWCHTPFPAKFMMTVDHVIPTSKGGFFGLGNCVPACEKCNQEKADRMPTQKEWERAMEFIITCHVLRPPKGTKYPGSS